MIGTLTQEGASWALAACPPRVNRKFSAGPERQAYMRKGQNDSARAGSPAATRHWAGPYSR
jgi:hypothetical protein